MRDARTVPRRHPGGGRAPVRVPRPGGGPAHPDDPADAGRRRAAAATGAGEERCGDGGRCERGFRAQAQAHDLQEEEIRQTVS